MISTSTKVKIRIEKIQVSSLDAVKTFQIKLPSNVKKVTSITVTSNI